MEHKSDTIMTINELSEYLKISTSSLYKLAQQGKVPGSKVGKHWRFHRESIDAWIKAGNLDVRTDSKRRA